MTEWVSPLSSGTSILSLIKLPSGRRKWQIQQHKGEQTVGVSSQQRAAEAISALPGLIQVTAAPPQSCARVTRVHLLDPAVPSHHDRAENCSVMRNSGKIWKRRQHITVQIQNGCYVFRKTREKKIKNKLIFELHCQAHSRQTHRPLEKSKGGIAEERLSHPKFWQLWGSV